MQRTRVPKLWHVVATATDSEGNQYLINNVVWVAFQEEAAPAALREAEQDISAAEGVEGEVEGWLTLADPVVHIHAYYVPNGLAWLPDPGCPLCFHANGLPNTPPKERTDSL